MYCETTTGSSISHLNLENGSPITLNQTLFHFAPLDHSPTTPEPERRWPALLERAQRMTHQNHLLEISASLKRVPFLKLLNDEQLLLLADRVCVQIYPAEAKLILEGTYGSTVFI